MADDTSKQRNATPDEQASNDLTGVDRHRTNDLDGPLPPSSKTGTERPEDDRSPDSASADSES